MRAQDNDGWTRAVMVVGAVVLRSNEVLLVHEHTLGGTGPDQWVLPGGRVEQGELLDAAGKREVYEETGLRAKSVGSLAFGSQHYIPSYSQPLLFLAFHVQVLDADQDQFQPNDPDGLIIEARFVPGERGDWSDSGRWHIPGFPIDRRLPCPAFRQPANHIALGSEPVDNRAARPAPCVT